jgi:hypothetical protein
MQRELDQQLEMLPRTRPSGFCFVLGGVQVPSALRHHRSDRIGVIVNFLWPGMQEIQYEPIADPIESTHPALRLPVRAAPALMRYRPPSSSSPSARPVAFLGCGRVLG